MVNLCDYGCNQPAKFKLKNGKLCCSESNNKCKCIRQKNSISVKNSRRIEKERGINRFKNLKKIECLYCKEVFLKNNITKHETSCYLNPKNLRFCPICEKVIKKKNQTTCSQKCAQIYFREQFNDIRKTRDMTWCNGHSYKFECFTYHKKECIICGERNIVAVHHYDGNNKNNEPTNFVPLCPTHHMYIHSKFAILIQEKVDNYVEEFKRMFWGGSIGEATGC